jgi:PAS domain S-box-containing protein
MEERSQVLGPEQTVNILLVDDQPEALFALEALLQGPERNIVKTLSGREALRQLLKADFALILLDVQMPDMDGFQTAELIRQRDSSKNTPIIFLTAGHKSEANIFRGYAVGAVDYVFKPIVPDILRSKVSAFVDLAKQSQLVRRQLAAIVESSDDAIIGETLDGIILTWNRAAERLYGYSAEEVKGRPISVLLPPDRPNELIAILERLRRGEGITHYETVRCRKDGRRIDVSLTVSPIKDAAGNVIGASAIARDITQRKQAERQLKRALKEKELLLQEIHHRVKNNLQIISSLLNIQSAGIEDGQALRAFKDSQSRIESIALIHEILSQSDDLSKVDFAQYVRELSHHLVASYGINPQDIELETEVDQTVLGIDTAIPCGLLITELLSNALIHGFPSGRKGKIRVDLRRVDGNQLALAVSDNGVGFPKEVDWGSTRSIGLQLVNRLAEQLRGTIEFHTNHGTEFKMTFANESGKDT